MRFMRCLDSFFDMGLLIALLHRPIFILKTYVSGMPDWAERNSLRKKDYRWLNRFGNLGTFLKNDIKLIRGTSDPKTSVTNELFSLFFYGFLFFNGWYRAYDGPVWKVFCGIF